MDCPEGTTQPLQPLPLRSTFLKKKKIKKEKQLWQSLLGEKRETKGLQPWSLPSFLWLANNLTFPIGADGGGAHRGEPGANRGEARLPR